jgi:ketol-acid reductoisomerase
MTATMYYDADASPDQLSDRAIAVIGYGSQGHAHALNLRDSGLDVRVGLPANSRSRVKACEAGIRVMTPAEATREADVIMVLVPDTAQAELYERELAPELTSGKTLMFAHGFNVHYGFIRPPASVDVSMVAPKSPGHRVRELYLEGAGTPALVAVAQDASGQALADALAYARALGCSRAGVIRTTFAEETETDLFGEQAVLCGGVSHLVKAGFDTLVEAGYQPELAYFECMHVLKLIVDLMYQGGLNYMRYSVSDTAEYGDYRSGPRVVTEDTRRVMQQLLTEIRDGSFAKEWVAEHRGGREKFNAARQRDRNHRLEQVGAQLRSMMPFVKPKVVAPDGSVA